MFFGGVGVELSHPCRNNWGYKKVGAENGFYIFFMIVSGSGSMMTPRMMLPSMPPNIFSYPEELRNDFPLVQ